MVAQELDWIQIKGFKSIADSGKVHLRAVNLVIGANGVGKSNFIGAFSFLQAIREGRLQNYVIESLGADNLLHLGSKQTTQIQLAFMSSGNEVNGYELTLSATQNDGLAPSGESVSFWDKRAYSSPYSTSVASDGKEAGISHNEKTGIASWVRARLDRWRLYHVHDTSQLSPLRKTNEVDDNDFLRANGSNLAAFLYRLKVTDKYSNSYELIRKTIQQVAPFFDDFLLRPDNIKSEVIKLAWRQKNTDKYFGASSLSDGTLRFIALATLLLQPKELRPSVILIDEPELGLHPAAITLLASLIHSVSTETQVIVATQSPQLLDHFEPADVLIAERENGATTFERLENDTYASWLEDYSLGQLWEKNELGGRPSSE